VNKLGKRAVNGAPFGTEYRLRSKPWRLRKVIFCGSLPALLPPSGGKAGLICPGISGLRRRAGLDSAPEGAEKVAVIKVNVAPGDLNEP
jgi:hypothetical protein